MNVRVKNDFYNELETLFDEQSESMKRPTVLICGYTGVGKTTVIQKICGKSTVPDSEISHCAPGTDAFVEYSTDLIRIWDSCGLLPDDRDNEFVEKTKDFVEKRRREESLDEHIHIVWYCIQGSGARVTPTDEKLINEIFDKKNTMVLITKNDITKAEQRDGIIKYLMSKGVSKDMIFPVSEGDNSSLEKVIVKTIDLLPEAYQEAFIAAQILSIEEKDKKAHAFIHGAAAAAAGVGATPIPFSDAPIIMGFQMTMIVNLALLYGFDKQYMMSMIAPALAKVAGKQLAASLTKLIPGFGHIVNAGVAFAITEAIGWQIQTYLKKQAIKKANGEPVNKFVFDWSEFEKTFKSIFKNIRKKLRELELK